MKHYFANAFMVVLGGVGLYFYSDLFENVSQFFNVFFKVGLLTFLVALVFITVFEILVEKHEEIYNVKVFIIYATVLFVSAVGLPLIDVIGLMFFLININLVLIVSLLVVIAKNQIVDDINKEGTTVAYMFRYLMFQFIVLVLYLNVSYAEFL